MFDNTTSTRQLALIVPSNITVGQTLAISQEDFEAFQESVQEAFNIFDSGRLEQDATPI